MPTQHEAITSAKNLAALNNARSLLAVGPMRGADPSYWVSASVKMLEFCQGREDVVEAALRVVNDHAKQLEGELAALKAERNEAAEAKQLAREIIDGIH
jgi:hypothetical protein